MWSSSSATAGRCSSSPRPRCPRAPRSSSRRTASRRASTPTRGPPAAHDRRDLPAGHEGARRGQEVRRRGLHDRARRARRARGGRGHDGRGARQHRADRERGGRRRARGRRSRRRSPTSRRRRCRSTRPARSSTACASASRQIVGPRTDDICYATTNRQAAVKQLASECDLVLVIGSRNSSNSNRLVEVAREHGADSYLIDNEASGARGVAEGKRVVGITSGASAPEELVQRLVEFFRERGTTTSGSSRSSRRTSASCSRRSIRQAMAARLSVGPSPGASDRCARWSSPTCTSGRARGSRRAARRDGPRRGLLEAWRGCDRLVLLGDVLELRHGPLRDGDWPRPAPVLRRCVGAALGAGREVVVVPGNHDHHLLAAWFERRAARRHRRRRSASRRRSTGASRRAAGAAWPSALGPARGPRRATRGCGCATTSTPPTATTATGTRRSRCSSGSAPGAMARIVARAARTARGAPRTTRRSWRRSTRGSTRSPSTAAPTAAAAPHGALGPGLARR